MSNPRGRRIVHLQLHSANCFFPGIGQLENTLPPSRKSMPGLMMYDQGDKVLLVIPGPNGTSEGFIPITNVQCALYEAEAPKAVVKPADAKTR